VVPVSSIITARFMLRLLLLTSIYVSIGFGFLQAAELHLSNGDRITGELIRRDGTTIHFRSPYLGEIVISDSQAVVVEGPDTPVESLAGLPPTVAPTSPLVSSSLPSPDSSARLTDASGAGGNHSRWKGKVEFGYQQNSGREDALNLTLRGEAERKVGVNSYRGEARLIYAKQQGVINTDRDDGSFRWRHELSERVFAQSLSSYTKDRVKQIDQNIEQNLGFGYRLFQDPRHSTNVGAGVTAQYREAFGINTGVSYLGELFQDYTYKLNGRITFTQDSSVLYSPARRGHYVVIDNNLVQSDGTNNYRLRFNSSLQGKITQRISMNLRFEYEFDNSVINRDARSDERISSSIGYGF
jgi:putative salt-induced outer membrane protein YdiY